MKVPKCNWKVIGRCIAYSKLWSVNQTESYLIHLAKSYCFCHSCSLSIFISSFNYLHQSWSLSASWVFCVSILWWVFYIFAFLELIYPKKAPLWLLGLPQFLFSMFTQRIILWKCHLYILDFWLSNSYMWIMFEHMNWKGQCG